MGWDFGRLFKTLVFFGAVPFAQLLGGSMATSYSPTIAANAGPILVIGSGDELSRAVVQRLSDRGGRRVQYLNLVESGPQAMEVFAGVSRQLPVAHMGRGASTIVLADVNRMVETRPETIVTLQEAIAQMDAGPQTASRVLFDFRMPSVSVSQVWGAVDDVVMGGVSQSGIRAEGGRAIFAGIVSIENSGGFASVRTRNLEPALDLSAYEGLSLRVRGDGYRYKVLLRDERRWDGIAYGFSFDTVAGQWMDVQVPFAQLIPVLRAKTVPDAPTIDRQNIAALQVMLSKFEYDGALNPTFEPGPFQLEIESISAYGNGRARAVVPMGIASEVTDRLHAAGLFVDRVETGGDRQVTVETYVRAIAH